MFHPDCAPVGWGVGFVLVGCVVLWSNTLLPTCGTLHCHLVSGPGTTTNFHHCVIEIVTVKDPPDVLDRQKCLDALAALRHAKWFQVRYFVISYFAALCYNVTTLIKRKKKEENCSFCYLTKVPDTFNK